MGLTKRFNRASHQWTNDHVNQQIWILLQHISQLRAQIKRLQQGYDL